MSHKAIQDQEFDFVQLHKYEDRSCFVSV